MTRRHAGGRSVAGLAVLTAGLGVLTAGIVTLHRPVAPPDAGTVPAAVAAPVPSRTAVAAPARSEAAGPVPAAPTRVSIAALHITAPVDPVAVARDGSLVIPETPSRLGWWIGSAVPGSDRGTVLIAGHVDTAAAGKGALFRLETLAVGARIGVRTADQEVTYRVVARHSYPKQHLPADLFRADTPARLVLVTCGGAFAHGRYSHNVVVYATPV
jgi:hypothetical protein